MAKHSSFTVTYRRHEDWCPPDRLTYRVSFEHEGARLDLLREILDRLQQLHAAPDLDGKRIRITLTVL